MEQREITEEKLEKYFVVTTRALDIAAASGEKIVVEGAREDFLDMISRYVSDAKYFQSQGEVVLAFAALNYAHGWLDAGARLGLFDVHDSTLFTVDEKN